MSDVVKVSGIDILDKRIETIAEAEQGLREADLMENYAFWQRGKSYKAIKEIIEEEEGREKYKSFKHYFDVSPVGESYSQASRLIQSFNQVEEIRANGTPDNELPKTERACRALRPKKKKIKKLPDLLADTLEHTEELIERLHLIEQLIKSGERPDPVKSQTLTAALETLSEILLNVLNYEK